MKKKLSAVMFTCIILGLIAPIAFTGGQQPGEVETTKTIIFWDQFSKDNEAAAVNEMIDKFMKLNVDVKIETTRFFGEDLKKVLKPAILSGEGPDIHYDNVGPGDLGVLVRAGEIYDLTDAYKEYGWDKRFFPWSVDFVTYGERIWAVPHELEFSGIFYNKKIFQKFGIEEPSDYNEFLRICEKMKSDGYLPLGLGNRSKWPAPLTWDEWLNNCVPKATLWKIFVGKESWQIPEVVKAFRLYQELALKGYFPDDANAISSDDAQMMFFAGKSAMYPMGTWLIKHFPKGDPGFEPGMFFLPEIDPRVGVKAPSASGSCYRVSASAKYPKACIDFIDYLMSPESVNAWLEKVNVIPPVLADVSKLNIPDTLKFSLNILYEHYQDLGTAMYMVRTKAFEEKMRDEMQNLLANKITPEEITRMIQEVWQQGIDEGLLIW
jgi:raffinose/stachyose/melibiose transport system substrate-binding protein